MAELAARGMRIDLPPGWDGHIYRRGAIGPAQTHDVLHASTFPLPPERGDFGGGAVELMGSADVFMAVFDFGPDSAYQPLFQNTTGVPAALTADQFSPNSLQRALPGQCGTQVFFTAGGHGLCLYVVLGSWSRRAELLAQVNSVLPSISIGVAS